ncbi:MAG: elongation factor P maturation arginine rhamnosyltransferase EarP [Gallionella sp.]|jgi:uncharacterized repeat protein (TIGR03837 family)
MKPGSQPATCDIFCNVIDNYGDIGVSWRLARQLANEFGIVVRLWVDDLESFAKLCPEADTALESQHRRGVEVRLWRKEFPDAPARSTPVGSPPQCGDPSAVQPAELVIEAFGCAMPESYLAAMTAQSVWINLEYLSAEDWVEGCHKLPSPRPPLTRYFFFPGFTQKTGGLLLERDLLARRDEFLSDVTKQQAFWQSIGMQMPASDTRKISLFAYENAALGSLFDAWADGEQRVLCLVPEGRILPQVVHYFAGQESRSYERGNLQVRVLPFVEQERYDELLWACDINFVRGEDSCVRAQWAGKPFIWQIYPQHDAVHWEKLQAFLNLYNGHEKVTTSNNKIRHARFPHPNLPPSEREGANESLREFYVNAQLSPQAARAMQDLWRAWNGGDDEGQAASAGSGQAWALFDAARGELNVRAQAWARELSENNLALNLLDFFQEIGRMRAFENEGQ